MNGQGKGPKSHDSLIVEIKYKLLNLSSQIIHKYTHSFTYLISLIDLESMFFPLFSIRKF